MPDMKRREFIALVGGGGLLLTVKVRRARGQQPARPPVIGYLSHGTPEGTAAFVAAVRKGLDEVGLVEGKVVTSELRWALHDADRLPALATDPVQAGLVASLNRPGGNITGISTMNLDLGSKWIELLHELLPAANRFAVLVNVENADSARSIITRTQEAALALGMQTEILFASNEREIDAALAGLGARAQALIMHPDVLFTQNLEKLATLAIREKLATLYSTRNFPQAGGLLSYGSSFLETQRQAGVYAGRILKGEKPGDLPVQRATKFDFVINLKTAKALGLEIPPTLLARADEVIE
jgi:putative ABC transport system substrate-binding protein